jgi:hypothetical protein
MITKQTPSYLDKSTRNWKSKQKNKEKFEEDFTSQPKKKKQINFKDYLAHLMDEEDDTF